MLETIKKQFRKHPIRTAIVVGVVGFSIMALASVGIITFAGVTGGLGPLGLGFLITAASGVAGLIGVTSNLGIMITLGAILGSVSLIASVIIGSVSFGLFKILNQKNSPSKKVLKDLSNNLTENSGEEKKEEEIAIEKGKENTLEEDNLNKENNMRTEIDNEGTVAYQYTKYEEWNDGYGDFNKNRFFLTSSTNLNIKELRNKTVENYNANIKNTEKLKSNDYFLVVKGINTRVDPKLYKIREEVDVENNTKELKEIWKADKTNENKIKPLKFSESQIKEIKENGKPDYIRETVDTQKSFLIKKPWR